MTENVIDKKNERKPNLVIMRVKDAEGNPITGLRAENVEVLAVTKKIEIEMLDTIQNTPGAFFVKI